MTQQTVDYQTNPFRVPHPSSAMADAWRDAFVARVCNICGDVRALWIPKKTDTTTSIDLSRRASATHKWTYDAAKTAADYVRRGAGWSMTFDGAADEADMPDEGILSFGDGAVDGPLSIVSLVKADDNTPAADATILSKWNEDTDAELREYRLFLEITTGHFAFQAYDESGDKYIGKQYETALTADTWTLLASTYDGSMSEEGIALYKDAVLLAMATLSDAVPSTYVAMENLTSKLLLAHNLSAASTPVAEGFWDGSMAFVALCAKALSADELWALKTFVNEYYDLTL